MEQEKIEEMLMEILEQVDHDIAKDYNPDTAEEPEFAEGEMASLVNIVKKYIK